MEKKGLLELRKRIKARKPNFIRQDSHKRMCVSKEWRRPRGIHSKMRHKFKSRKACPSRGYRSPVLVRGLHASGLASVVVASKKDLEKIDKKNEGAVIARTVGLKKRIELVGYAKEKGIRILNIKDPDLFLKKAKERIEKKREKKVVKEKEKKERKEAKPKKEKEALVERLTEEEKKEQEKKEKDKLLTKKEV